VKEFFENRPVFDEVMCRLRRLTFFGPPCTLKYADDTGTMGAYLIIPASSHSTCLSEFQNFEAWPIETILNLTGKIL